MAEKEKFPFCWRYFQARIDTEKNDINFLMC